MSKFVVECMARVWFRLRSPAQRSRTVLRWPVLVALALVVNLIALLGPGSWNGLDRGGQTNVARAGEQSTPIVLNALILATEIPLWQPVIEEFERSHPGITVQLVEAPSSSNLTEDLYTSSFILGDGTYDLVYGDIAWVPKFAAAGWLQDLSGRLSATEAADFLVGDLAGGRYKNGLYRLPFRSDAGMLYYRTDLLEQAGLTPPQTFQELLDAAKILQAQGIPWGYVWQGRQYEGLAAMFVEVLAGYGGFWIDPGTGVVGLDRPQAIAALRFLQDTLTQGVVPPGVTSYQEEETRRLFQNGEVAFLRNWPYVWPLAQGEDSPIRGKIGIQPMVDVQGNTGRGCLGGWGWSIARTSPHGDAAWELIEFLSSAPIQKRIALESGYLPTRRSLYQDPELLAKYPHFRSMLAVLENTTLRPPVPQYAQASDILQRYLSAALTGQTSARGAMQSAAEETRRLLTR